MNLLNCNTVELRIFRGTLNIDTFYATLQLVDEICKCAINMSDYEFERMSWLDFVSKINKDEKPKLIKYLKLKQLYVNEPVGTEGEILTICTCGKILRDKFNYTEYSYCSLWDWRMHGLNGNNDYIEDLKSVSKYYGYEPDDIDSLIEEGFTPDEIEEYIYCME